MATKFCNAKVSFSRYTDISSSVQGICYRQSAIRHKREYSQRLVTQRSQLRSKIIRIQQTRCLSASDPVSDVPGTLFVFGFGYTALGLAKQLVKKGW